MAESLGELQLTLLCLALDGKFRTDKYVKDFSLYPKLNYGSATGLVLLEYLHQCRYMKNGDMLSPPEKQ